ncbi:MAG TPA: DNA polymerase I [Armatimonadota bacterium]|nr:DNA polymerase I [Armatimonadota bacterium]
MSRKGKAILIDGNSLLYRAFFAMPHFSTLENQPTNAVYGFTMMLLRLIQEEKPDILLVAFDAPAKTFRHEEFEEYKAHRKPAPDELVSQQPIAREMIDAFNIARLEVAGFEADDVVGTLARKAEAEDYDVTIVTGDLDALQLVDPKVRVMTTVKGVSETVVYDEDAVERRYDVRPAQLPDYKGLKGDPSDNIPGVPGIGDKTAARLIKEYGSLENLLYHAEDLKESKLQNTLVESSDKARLSKRLATIVTDVPVDIDLSNCGFRKPDYARLRDIFKRLEFRSLIKKLPEETGQRGLFASVEAEALTQALVIRRPAQLDALLTDVRGSGSVAIRIHGTSLRGVDAEPLGMAVSVPSGKAYYMAFGEDTGIRLEDLRPILESEAVEKYGYNLKYEYELAKSSGIEIRGPAFDVLLAAYLLNASRSAQELADIASDYALIEIPARDATAQGKVALEEVLAAEVDAIGRLVPILGARLAEDGLGRLMADIEMPLVRVLAEIELAGVALDTDWLQHLSVLFEERIRAVEREIHRHAGTEFNIGSPKQLQTILFDKLGLPAEKKTKTGYSTDAETLAALAPAHEIVTKILEYRELTKLKSTYVNALPKLISPRTGRVHTSLNQAVTATGRLSSSEPNLQNIPIKTEIGREIRKAFVASPGNLLVAADYSQIELRILAHVSGDPELLRAFRDEEDIHTRTAMKLFSVSTGEVTPEMRRQAKTVNFAVIYGMSDYGLSRELNIPTAVAKRYIESYFQEYPGVKLYAAETLSRARLAGYVESLLGRRRYIPELNSPNRNYREFAERAAVNMPIQGTAADIVKIAMIRVHERLKHAGLRAELVLQVHDELVFDVPESEVNRAVQIVRQAMEGAFDLKAPLKVDVKAGKDWCTALPVSVENHDETLG